MIRQREREQLNRLSSKTLDQVFVMRVKETMTATDAQVRTMMREREKGRTHEKTALAALTQEYS